MARLACCMLLFMLGSSLIWRANRDIFATNSVILIVWILNFAGAMTISLTDPHYLTIFLVSLGVFCFGLGSYFFAAVMRFRPIQELEKYRRQPVTFRFERLTVLRVLSAAFFVTLILGTLYFHDVGIPLFSKDVTTVRINSAAGRGLLVRAIDTFLPLLMLLAFMNMKEHKSKASRVLFCIITATNIVAAIFIGTRGQIVMYALLFLLLYSFTISKIGIRKLVSLGIAFLMFALLLQTRYADWRGSSILVQLKIFFSRFTASQVLGLDFIVYHLVPESGFSLGGVLLNDFKGLLYTLRVVNTYTPPYWVVLFGLMHGANARGSFIMTTTPVGDLYLDFGMAGVVLGMFMLGSFSQMLYIYTLRSRKDWLLSAGLIYLQFSIIMVNVLGGFFTVFSSYVVSLVAFLLLVLFLCTLFLLLKHMFRREKMFA